MRYAPVLLFAVVALSPGRSAMSQPMPQGTKVRFGAPEVFDGWRVARVVQMSGDSVRVAFSTGDSALIATSKISFMEQSRGKHTPVWAALSPIPLTAVGAVGGLFLGLISATMAGDHALDVIVWGGGVGAAAGFASGIVLATTLKTERWVPVRLGVVERAEREGLTMSPPKGRSTRLLLTPGRNRVRIGVHATF